MVQEIIVHLFSNNGQSDLCECASSCVCVCVSRGSGAGGWGTSGGGGAAECIASICSHVGSAAKDAGVWRGCELGARWQWWTHETS